MLFFDYWRLNSGELPPGSHHTQPKLFSRFLFQTQNILLWLRGELKMIARLPSTVFYIITRKLLGAFYVDQKKKGLLPSTLPSEHKQWGLFYNQNGLSAITYPIALSSKPWAIITTEGDPAGWNISNGIAIAGADIETASTTQANILSKWVLNGGTIKQGGQTIRVLIIGV